MPNKALPPQVNLSFFKKQATRLKGELDSGDDAALKRVQSGHPRLQQAGPPPAFKLSDAQLVVAREYGFDSWPKLKAALGPSENLDKARNLQNSYLPKELPSLPGLDLHGLIRAAEEVGGDYYDVVKLEDGRTAFMMADINGKGLPGAEAVSHLRNLLHQALFIETTPSAVLKTVNRALVNRNLEGIFIVCFLIILDSSKKKMTYCSAGHAPALFRKGETGKVEALNPKGIALVFDKGPVFDRTLREGELTLSQGDRVLLASDALELEGAMDWDRLSHLLEEQGERSSRELLEIIEKEWAQNVKDPEHPDDDVTLMTFRMT